MTDTPSPPPIAPGAPAPAAAPHPALSPPALALACALRVALLVWTTGWLRFDAPTAAPVSSLPRFGGQVTPGATAVALTILPTGQRWTAPVDPTTGVFVAAVPTPLAPGSYAIYVDDNLGQEFVVAPDQP